MKNILTTFIYILISSVLLIACHPQTEVTKQTEVYAIKDTDTLRLDKYDYPQITGVKPCVIFMFGGAFTHGSRMDNLVVDYMHNLAKKGYVAIAIDYRLGLKDLQPEQLGELSQFVRSTYHAVNISVEDLLDATNYIIEHATEWSIDKDKIIANGSSSGAISALQAAYYLSHKNPEYISKLPNDFKYAGIISFAGALLGNEGIQWGEKPAPILLFHGNADSNVPYDKLTFGPVGLYGSKSIVASLDSIQSPYYFCSFNNRAHEIASTPTTDNLNEIVTFIERYVNQKQEEVTIQYVRKANEEVTEHKFEISDFIRSNYQ